MTQTIAIYLRVSSRRQDTRSQEPDLARWVDAFAGGQPVRWYRDRASGKTMAAGLTSLFERLHSLRINLVSIRDSLDLSTPSGRLMGHILASVSVYENEVRSERIRAGQAVARANGKRWGGRKAGVRVRVKPEQIQTIRRMAADGESKSAMSRATGLSRPTIYSVLESL